MKKKIEPTKLSPNEINKLSGNRLKECMDLKEKKASELSRWIEGKGFICSDKYISLIKNGHRPISPSNAYLFAEFLGVDSGYLLGKDFWLAQSYDEYQGIVNDMEKQLKQQEADLEKLHLYDNYLKPCGYKVDMTINLDGGPPSYKIIGKGKTVVFSEDEMKKFKREIDKYIKLKMDALMLEHKIDSST